MIKLFITDIDGCLLEPFLTPDWQVMAKIKELNEKSESQTDIPPLTICTGRPLPYAEATAQWMGIQLPIVFESAGVLHLSNYEVSVNGTFDDEAKRKISELKKWLGSEIISSYNGMQAEFFKIMDAGLIHPKEKVILQALPKVKEYVSEHYQDFEVHHTGVSINIILKGNNKRSGIQKLCDLQGISPDEVAYIGDSSGDIPGLDLVGLPYAPTNASDGVKQVANVLSGRASEAVLEAYQQVITENRNNANVG